MAVCIHLHPRLLGVSGGCTQARCRCPPPQKKKSQEKSLLTSSFPGPFPYLPPHWGREKALGTRMPYWSLVLLQYLCYSPNPVCEWSFVAWAFRGGGGGDPNHYHHNRNTLSDIIFVKCQTSTWAHYVNKFHNLFKLHSLNALLIVTMALLHLRQIKSWTDAHDITGSWQMKIFFL